VFSVLKSHRHRRFYFRVFRGKKPLPLPLPSPLPLPFLFPCLPCFPWLKAVAVAVAVSISVPSVFSVVKSRRRRRRRWSNTAASHRGFVQTTLAFRRLRAIVLRLKRQGFQRPALFSKRLAEKNR